MQLSGELRWFWPSPLPVEVERWFCSSTALAAGGGRWREDLYLLDRQSNLGVKLRGGRPGVEIKGMVSGHFGELAVAPFLGTLQLWVKWTSSVLTLTGAPLLSVSKRRLLRKFFIDEGSAIEVGLGPDEKPCHGRPLPVTGCNFEITEINIKNGSPWWTAAFESFGAPETLASSAMAVASALALTGPDLNPQEAVSVSYPEWLAQFVADMSASK